MSDTRRFWIFILVTFGFGWLMQAAGMLLGGVWYQLCVAAGMFAPLLGTLAAGKLPSVRWRPNVTGHGRWYLLALWGPAAMTVVCAAWYFILRPAAFDASAPYLSAQLEAAGAEAPFSLGQLMLIQIMEAVTFAPFMNAALAVGEEAGWRGYLTPYLTGRLGRRPGLILSGVIWGAWHWPLILLAGYEYGTGYPGAPYTGMALMCLGAAAMGILLTLLYERADSIWPCALAHGAVNAAAGLGILFLSEGTTSYFLGPTPLGLLSGVPLYALALWALLAGRARDRQKKTENVEGSSR